MDRITIASGNTAITMPRVRAVEVGAEEVSQLVTMASGKVVKEMHGVRPVVTASWDWLPAKTIADLHRLLRTDGFFSVTYPDPAGGERTARFSIGYPTTKIFKFYGTEPRWHDVTLTMTGQEVI